MSATLTYNFELTRENLATALNWIVQKSTENGATERQIFTARLCSEELLVNIISHSKSISINTVVQLQFSAGSLRLTIMNDGPSFNPFLTKPRSADASLDTARPGGWGIPFLRHFSDKCDCQHNNNQNIVSLEFNQ